MAKINDDTINKPVYMNPFIKFIAFFIPVWVARRKELSTGAKLAYGALCRHAGKNGECWMSQRTLAQELGRSRDSINRWVKELKEYGLIKVLSRGRGRTRLYRFIFKAEWIRDSDLRKDVVMDDLEFNPLTGDWE